MFLGLNTRSSLLEVRGRAVRQRQKQQHIHVYTNVSVRVQAVKREVQALRNPQD